MKPHDIGLLSNASKQENGWLPAEGFGKQAMSTHTVFGTIRDRVLGKGGKNPTTSAGDDEGSYLPAACKRTISEAYRFIHIGDLTPQSGAFELVSDLAEWAIQNPGRNVEVRFFGEGIMRRILQAQPKLNNMTMCFQANGSTDDIQKSMAECGILALTSRRADADGIVSLALQSGLVVLGNSRSRAIRNLVHQKKNGVLYKPSEKGSLFQAIDRLMQSPADVLDAMRYSACGASPGAATLYDHFRTFQSRLTPDIQSEAAAAPSCL